MAMTMVGGILGGRITGRIGPRLPMAAGMFVGAMGLFALMTVDAQTPYGFLVPVFIVIGFGTSLTLPSATSAVMEAAPPEASGAAAGVLNASRQVGGTLGVAVLGAVAAAGGNLTVGLHEAGLVAGAVFLLASAVSVATIKSTRAEIA
jgi:DHA2 family methylenomycin A resistance protein-like MFS transporter